MNKTLIRSSEFIYELLLKFYPANYRQEYGEEMKYVFSESLKDAYNEYGEQGIITLWARTSQDAIKSIFTQHLENLKGGDTMNKNTTPSKNLNKRLSMWAVVVAAILMIPLVAKFPWTIFDFILAGIVLFGSATTYELATRKMTNKTHRIIVAIAVFAFLVLVQAWAAAGPD